MSFSKSIISHQILISIRMSTLEMKCPENTHASRGGALNLPMWNENSSSSNGLLDHSLKWVSHKSFYCVVPGCDVQLSPYPLEILSHFELMHENVKPNHCTQCYYTFDTWIDLCKHASETHHDAYICFYSRCGFAFRRSGDLTRHQLTHKENVRRYPCPHCSRSVVIIVSITLPCFTSSSIFTDLSSSTAVEVRMALNGETTLNNISVIIIKSNQKSVFQMELLNSTVHSALRMLFQKLWKVSLITCSKSTNRCHTSVLTIHATE